jgi:hypothetical protein
MTTWCSDVNFSKDLKESVSEYNLFDKSSEVFDENVDVILHHWLTCLSKMAVEYASIAYGNVSFETKIFKDILAIWMIPPNLRAIDYKKCHMLMREYILLLC